MASNTKFARFLDLAYTVNRWHELTHDEELGIQEDLAREGRQLVQHSREGYKGQTPDGTTFTLTRRNVTFQPLFKSPRTLTFYVFIAAKNGDYPARYIGSHSTLEDLYKHVTHHQRN